MTESTSKGWRFNREVTITHGIGAMTALGLITVGTFNLGFFSFAHWSFVSLLTIQDMTTGLLVALIPALLPTAFLALAMRGLHMASGATMRWIARGSLLLSVPFMVWSVFADLDGRMVVFVLSLSVAMISLFAIVFNQKTLPILSKIALAMVLYLAGIFAFGEMSYHDQVSAYNRLSGVENDRLYRDSQNFMDVYIVRVTSSYVFYLKNGLIGVAQLSDIARITRLGLSGENG